MLVVLGALFRTSNGSSSFSFADEEDDDEADGDDDDDIDNDDIIENKYNNLDGRRRHS